MYRIAVSPLGQRIQTERGQEVKQHVQATAAAAQCSNGLASNQRKPFLWFMRDKSGAENAEKVNTIVLGGTEFPRSSSSLLKKSLLTIIMVLSHDL